jgi:glucose/mannose transport system substrate-binding protein
VFPKTTNAEAIKAQKMMAGLMLAPTTQVEFSNKKGSIPVRTDVDVSKMDVCAQQGLAIMKDKSRQLGNGEVYLNPDQNGSMSDILTTYWNKAVPVEKVQKDIAAALKN